MGYFSMKSTSKSLPGGNRMRFIKLLLLMVALAPTLALAQVQVIGFEIGTSTVQQVKSQLAKQQAKILDDMTNKFTGGPQFRTDGGGYDIESLTEVVYIFGKDRKLAAVVMTMSKERFDEIFNFLAGKYKTTAKQRPFVGDKFARFKANGAVIELEAPHLSFNMQASYIRDDLYQQFNAQTAQETQQKKATEKSKF